MRKEIDLSKLADLVAEGPAGKDKINRQARAINELQEALMLVYKRTRPYEIPVRTKDSVIKFGVIGDTQIGSFYQRTDALKLFYETCAREGIRHVLHVGDVIEGWRVYKGQEFELHPSILRAQRGDMRMTRESVLKLVEMAQMQDRESVDALLGKVPEGIDCLATYERGGYRAMITTISYLFDNLVRLALRKAPPDEIRHALRELRSHCHLAELTLDEEKAP